MSTHESPRKLKLITHEREHEWWSSRYCVTCDDCHAETVCDFVITGTAFPSHKEQVFTSCCGKPVNIAEGLQYLAERSKAIANQ